MYYLILLAYTEDPNFLTIQMMRHVSLAPNAADAMLLEYVLVLIKV